MTLWARVLRCGKVDIRVAGNRELVEEPVTRTPPGSRAGLLPLSPLILPRTFEMVSFCLTVIPEGGQNDQAYRNDACDGVAPAGH
jgi:hypothetical protein